MELYRSEEVTEAWRERATLNVEEAARVLGLGRGSTYAAIKAGEIPAVRIGRRWLVPVGGLMAFLDGAKR